MSIRHGRHSRHGDAGPSHGGRFLGTTTLGERGQIVIPKEARDLFGLAPGDKLLVLGDENRGGLALVKADMIEAFIARFLGGDVTAGAAGPGDAADSEADRPAGDAQTEASGAGDDGRTRGSGADDDESEPADPDVAGAKEE